MTRFRTVSRFLSFTIAIAFSVSAANACDVFKNMCLADVLVTGATDGAQSNLPAPPPKFSGTPAAPQSGRTIGNDRLNSGHVNDLMRPAPTGPSSLALRPSPLPKPNSLKTK